MSSRLLICSSDQHTGRLHEAAQLAVPGQWEGDLIAGALNQTAIATMVEGGTRYVMLVHLGRDHTAETVRDGLIRTMGGLPGHLGGSLGIRARRWHRIRPSAWPRTWASISVIRPAPGNENTNGLLRQYFPKGADLSVHSVEDLEHVAQQLSGSPRKTLGWEKSAERMRDLLLTT